MGNRIDPFERLARYYRNLRSTPAPVSLDERVRAELLTQRTRMLVPVFSAFFAAAVALVLIALAVINEVEELSGDSKTRRAEATTTFGPRAPRTTWSIPRRKPEPPSYRE